MSRPSPWKLYAATAVAAVVFGVFSMVSLLAAPLQLLALPWDRARRVAGFVARWWWSVGMIAAQPLWSTWVTGRERLPRTGGYLLVANHQSMLDIPLLLHLADARVVARPGVFRIPGIGWLARLGGHVSIDPADPTSIERARGIVRGYLARGIPVVVFPEGTRSPDGALQPFQRGALQLALDNRVPVVPVALYGSRHAMPKGTIVCDRPRVRFHVQVLPPLPPPGEDAPLARRALAQEARTRIATALDGPRPWEIVDAVGAAYRPQGRFREGWARGKVRADPVFWMLHERIGAGSVVDLGCGEGLLAHYLRAGGHPGPYRGYDLDAERVAVARAAGVDASVADARRITPERPDHIVIIDVLHYLSPEDQAGLLSRMCASLAPGGRLYVRDPEPRGAGGGLTVGSERLLVAAGRHQVAGDHRRVRAMGGAWIASVLGRTLDDVTIEEGSPGTPFRNVLVSGRATSR